jgi:hypothetical protein
MWERRETDEEERQGVNVEWDGETVNCLETTEDDPPYEGRDEINR